MLLVGSRIKSGKKLEAIGPATENALSHETALRLEAHV